MRDFASAIAWRARPMLPMSSEVWAFSAASSRSCSNRRLRGRYPSLASSRCPLSSSRSRRSCSSLDLRASISPNICASRPAMFSRTTAISPASVSRRAVNSRCCRAIAAAARGSDFDAIRSGGNVIAPAPICSAISRASKAWAENSCPRAISSWVRGGVASRRISTCPALTVSPSLTPREVTIPEASDWTDFRLPVTTTEPGEVTPSSSGASVAQATKPPKPTSSSSQPQRRGRASLISNGSVRGSLEADSRLGSSTTVSTTTASATG